jgi:hypothetical protein
MMRGSVQIEFSQREIGGGGFRTQPIQGCWTETDDPSLLFLGAPQQDDIHLLGEIIVAGRVGFEGATRTANRDSKDDAGFDQGGVGVRCLRFRRSPLGGGSSREIDHGGF